MISVKYHNMIIRKRSEYISLTDCKANKIKLQGGLYIFKYFLLLLFVIGVSMFKLPFLRIIRIYKSEMYLQYIIASKTVYKIEKYVLIY